MTTEIPSPVPSLARAWLMASRPATLPAAVVPVLVGTAVAVSRGHFHLLAFVAALLAAILIQIGTNLANDYFDFRKGADTSERLGPVRVTQSGLIPPETVRAGTLVIFGLAALVGLYLVTVGGLPILVVGVLSLISGVLYTGGPWPLAYNGLGDLFVFIFFGLVAVLGTEYLHAGSISTAGIIASLPVAMLVTAIIVVNNLRDIDTDRKAGKRTLAVRIGRPATRIEYHLLVAGSYLLLPLALLAGTLPAWSLLPWLTVPLALRLTRAVSTVEGRSLNSALAGTGRLHLLFGLLFAASLLP